MGEKQVLRAEVCAICSHSDHTTETCPMSSFADKEQVNYVRQSSYQPKNNPFSNTYNQVWRNHPKFSWSNGQNFQNLQGQQKSYQQGSNFQNQQQTQEWKKVDFESTVLQLLQQQQQTSNQQGQAI